MPRIAISYRRADSAAISGRIFDRLTQRYGPASVFMDIDEIPFGIDFRDHVAQVLSTCDAVVVVIGRSWLGEQGGERRIDQATDPVRVEVQTALDRKIPVVPVLVDGAEMPAEATLPAPLRALAFRNACPIDTGRDFHAHVDRLIRSMDRILPAGSAPPSPPARAEPPASTTAAPALSPVSTLILAAFVALPQAVQFLQRTPLFVAALAVSTIGTATVLDRPEESPLRRTLVAMGIMAAAVMGQSALGVLRASFATW